MISRMVVKRRRMRMVIFFDFKTEVLLFFDYEKLLPIIIKFYLLSLCHYIIVIRGFVEFT